jgi:hypothetical protein
VKDGFEHEFCVPVRPPREICLCPGVTSIKTKLANVRIT